MYNFFLTESCSKNLKGLCQNTRFRAVNATQWSLPVFDLIKYRQVQPIVVAICLSSFIGWSAANMQWPMSYGIQILTYLLMAGTFSHIKCPLLPLFILSTVFHALLKLKRSNKKHVVKN